MVKKNMVKTRNICLGIIIIFALITIVGYFMGGTTLPDEDNIVSIQIPSTFKEIDGNNYVNGTGEYTTGTGYLLDITKINNTSTGLKSYFGEDFTLKPVNGLTNVYYDLDLISESCSYFEMVKINNQTYIIEFTGDLNGEYVDDDYSLVSVEASLEDYIKEFNSLNNVSPIQINL